MRLLLTIGLLIFAANANALSAPSSTNAPSDSLTGTYTVSWPSASGATVYVLFESINYGPYSALPFTSSTSVTRVAQSQGTYLYTVGACNAGGCAPTTSPVTVVSVAPPDAPAQSSGTFVLDWVSEAGADAYPVYMSYNYGPYSLVSAEDRTRFYARGKKNGTYLFTVGACNATTCAPSTSPVKQVIVSGNSNPRPDTYHEQLLDEYEVRTGDFNGDTRRDILIDRMTPGQFIDGSIQSTILYQNADKTFSASTPSGGQLQHARSYPIDNAVDVDRGDENFDGYMDLILNGLDVAIGNGVLQQTVFAPANPGQSTPANVLALTDSVMQFWSEVSAHAADNSYFIDNVFRNLRFTYGVAISCSSEGIFETLFSFTCVPIPVITGVTSDASFHPQSWLSGAALQDILTNRDYTDQDMVALSDLLFPVLGVRSFGVQPNGDIEPNTSLDEDVEDGQERNRWTISGALRKIGKIILDQGGPHEEHDTDDIFTEVCDPAANPVACSIEQVFCELRKYPALEFPWSPDNTHYDGDTTGVSVLGPVVHTIDENTNTILNTTLETADDVHLLHPGVVERQVVQDPSTGKILIRTVSAELTASYRRTQR